MNRKSLVAPLTFLTMALYACSSPRCLPPKVRSVQGEVTSVVPYALPREVGLSYRGVVVTIDDSTIVRYSKKMWDQQGLQTGDPISTTFKCEAGINRGKVIEEVQ